MTFIEVQEIHNLNLQELKIISFIFKNIADVQTNLLLLNFKSKWFRLDSL